MERKFMTRKCPDKRIPSRIGHSDYKISKPRENKNLNLSLFRTDVKCIECNTIRSKQNIAAYQNNAWHYDLDKENALAHKPPSRDANKNLRRRMWTAIFNGRSRWSSKGGSECVYRQAGKHWLALHAPPVPHTHPDSWRAGSRAGERESGIRVVTAASASLHRTAALHFCTQCTDCTGCWG